MPSKKLTVSIVVIILALTISITSIWYVSPALSGPHIDASWQILCRTDDTWDPYSAEWIHAKYSASIIDLTQGQDYNDRGQNLLIIGGSATLSEQAPWLEIWGPLTITKPHTFPEVRFEWDDTIDDFKLITPTTIYSPNQDNELGFIARGYDYTLRRYIVACIGFNWYGTAFGAKLLCLQWDKLVGDNTYVVFRCTSYGSIDPTQWSFSDFDGIILEYGG